jgi:flagellar biosynthesis protein FlhB
MSEDKSDKIFDPTAQRLLKAREEGNLFKSQDISSIVLLAVSMSMIGVFLPVGFEGLKNIAARVFLASASTPVTLASIPSIIQGVGRDALLVMAPFVGALFVSAIGIQVAQSGINFTMKPLEPKPDRISPVKGFGRIFSAKGAFNSLKAIVKISVVGPIAYSFISGHMEEILMLPGLGITEILTLAGGWMGKLVFQILIALTLLSIGDVAFEKWNHKRDLKMSKQEIKDESRESEGDPQVKVRRKQLAMEMKRRPRLDHAILKADVVITNPTHFAVMLQYDPEISPAPLVLAKGIRKRALRIKSLAKEHEVPLVEDRPLARALYHTVPETGEIPADLYPAVATILAELYRKTGKSL